MAATFQFVAFWRGGFAARYGAGALLAKLTDDDFASIWRTHGNATRVAAATGMAERSVHGRRRSLQKKGFDLPTIAQPGYESRTQHGPDEGWTFPREKRIEIWSGTAVVFSDPHYWPGPKTVAHQALLNVIGITKPRVVFANGDVVDGATTGRHPPMGFSVRPTPVDELHACQERLGEVEQAIPNGCQLLWNIGNHDLRWERTLATRASEFAELRGFRLAHHFAAWDLQWSTLVNPAVPIPTMIKHRFQSAGIHAGYNAVLKGGINTVSGHTHLLGVNAWGDYRGRRYGVQTGSCSDLHAPQFEYHENNPSPACSGFAVLTFRDGRLLHPELCEILDGKAWFRGEIVA